MMIVAAIVCLVTLPGTIYLLSLTTAGLINSRFITRKRPRPNPHPVCFAVVIPAHNEGGTVLTAINSIKQCHKPKGTVDIVVVADNCTDDTAAIAEQSGCRVLIRQEPDRRGKGYALRFAFDQLKSEGHNAYIVIDADTRCQANLITEFESFIGTGSDVVQAPYLVENNAKGMYGRVSGIGLRAFNFLRPSGRDLMGLSAGIFGTGFALTRKVLDAVPYTADSVVEDLEYHIALVRNNFKSKFVSHTAVYSPMPVSQESSQTQRSRWEGGRARITIDNVIPLTRDVFKGRWRLLEPLLELLLLPLWIHVSMLLLALLLGWAVGSQTIGIYALGALVVVLGHVICAILCTGGGLRELSVILIVPRYILWKFGIANKILSKTGKDADWERTGRD